MDQQGGISAVLWLARREIARMKVSYLATGAFMLFMGTIAASIVEAGALGLEQVNGPDSVLADIVVLLLTTLLATNYTFWGSHSDWTNQSERKLVFMRTLPIPVSTLVGSRMISLLTALPLTVPAFFLPIYLLSDIRLGTGAYVAFVVFWIGYSLIWAGINMYFEIVGGSKFFFWISVVAALMMLGLIVLVGVGLGIRIVYEVANLMSSYGLLAATASLIVGIIAFILAGRLAKHGLLEREIPV